MLASFYPVLPPDRPLRWDLILDLLTATRRLAAQPPPGLRFLSCPEGLIHPLIQPLIDAVLGPVELPWMERRQAFRASPSPLLEPLWKAGFATEELLLTRLPYEERWARVVENQSGPRDELPDAVAWATADLARRLRAADLLRRHNAPDMLVEDQLIFADVALERVCRVRAGEPYLDWRSLADPEAWRRVGRPGIDGEPAANLGALWPYPPTQPVDLCFLPDGLLIVLPFVTLALRGDEVTDAYPTHGLNVRAVAPDGRSVLLMFGDCSLPCHVRELRQRRWANEWTGPLPEALAGNISDINRSMVVDLGGERYAELLPGDPSDCPELCQSPDGRWVWPEGQRYVLRAATGLPIFDTASAGLAPWYLDPGENEEEEVQEDDADQEKAAEHAGETRAEPHRPALVQRPDGRFRFAIEGRVIEDDGAALLDFGPADFVVFDSTGSRLGIGRGASIEVHDLETRACLERLDLASLRPQLDPTLHGASFSPDTWTGGLPEVVDDAEIAELPDGLWLVLLRGFGSLSALGRATPDEVVARVRAADWNEATLHPRAAERLTACFAALPELVGARVAGGFLSLDRAAHQR